MVDIPVDQVIEIARQAGESILSVYHSDTIDIWQKADHSPLTEADLLAHRTIVNGLNQLTPEIPIISEESVNEAYPTRAEWSCFWLVDPLDGTKEFLKRNDQFTVNIALVVDHQPVFGVIYSPVEDKLYYATKGEGAYRQIDSQPVERLITQERSISEPLRVVVSKSHSSTQTEDFVHQFTSSDRPIEHVAIGSSLKFCLIAEGSADIYPRLVPTMEWDTAAGQIIVNEAGKEVIVIETGEPLQYNKESLRNPSFIVK